MQASLLFFFVAFVVNHDKIQHARTTVGIIHEIKKINSRKTFLKSFKLLDFNSKGIVVVLFDVNENCVIQQSVMEGLL